jgi:hypothetical protein
MVQEVNWDSIGNESENNYPESRPKVEYLRVPDNGKSKIRLVSAPVQYYKHWDPIMAISPGKDSDPLFPAGYKAQRNFGLWVMDRVDGTMKVFNCSKKILLQFVEWKENNQGKNPEDFDHGFDWVVSKKFVDKKWQYNAQPIAATPLTEEERERVNQKLEESPLEDVFRPHTPDELQEMFDSWKQDPSGPKPGTSKWYKARREASQGATTATSSGVNFDDDNVADIADDGDEDPSTGSEDAGSGAGYDGLFDDQSEASESPGSLF